MRQQPRRLANGLQFHYSSNRFRNIVQPSMKIEKIASFLKFQISVKLIPFRLGNIIEFTLNNYLPLISLTPTIRTRKSKRAVKPSNRIPSIPIRNTYAIIIRIVLNLVIALIACSSPGCPPRNIELSKNSINPTISSSPCIIILREIYFSCSRLGRYNCRSHFEIICRLI